MVAFTHDAMSGRLATKKPSLRTLAENENDSAPRRGKMKSSRRNSPFCSWVREMTMTPQMISTVPKKAPRVQCSPTMSTARIEANIGVVLTTGMERATPSRSMETYTSQRPRPEANRPPTAKYQMAWVQKTASGSVAATMDQRVRKEMAMEMANPASGLD